MPDKDDSMWKRHFAEKIHPNLSYRLATRVGGRIYTYNDFKIAMAINEPFVTHQIHSYRLYIAMHPDTRCYGDDGILEYYDQYLAEYPAFVPSLFEKQEIDLLGTFCQLTRRGREDIANYADFAPLAGRVWRAFHDEVERYNQRDDHYYLQTYDNRRLRGYHDLFVFQHKPVSSWL